MSLSMSMTRNVTRCVVGMGCPLAGGSRGKLANVDVTASQFDIGYIIYLCAFYWLKGHMTHMTHWWCRCEAQFIWYHIPPAHVLNICVLWQLFCTLVQVFPLQLDRMGYLHWPGSAFRSRAKRSALPGACMGLEPECLFAESYKERP